VSPDPTRKRIAAVVPTYNRKAILAECVRSLLAQTEPLAAIYIVDNASSDGTSESISKFDDGRVHYHRMARNTGSAGAVSYGVQSAYQDQFDWIWILDDDAYPAEDCLAQMMRAMDATAMPAAIAARKISDKGHTLESSWIRDAGTRRVVQPSEQRYREPFISVDYTGGCGLLLNSKIVARAGFPRAELFFGFEDYEYCGRLREHGPLILVPAALIRHPERQPIALISSYWRIYYAHRNMLYLALRARSRVFPSATAAEVLWEICVEISRVVLRYDAKLWRIRVLLAAACHGVMGRLGEGPAWLRPGEPHSP
jgi:rhamnopyranosyl-N-acetylglucosaminyl-diphospho-decaprenol beta-1,3/1,4-galactofuranosyltransferase